MARVSDWAVTGSGHLGELAALLFLGEFFHALSLAVHEKSLEVVDASVLHKRREHERETHDNEPVQRCRVVHPRQRGAASEAHRHQSQHRCSPWKRTEFGWKRNKGKQ